MQGPNRTTLDRNAGKPEEELKQASAEGQFSYEGWRIRKDGSRFWADVIITALHDESGKVVGFSKVMHDITERKKAEEALSFSEARFRALFRDNPTMIFTLNTRWTILSANPSCTSQLGYTIDELEGQSVLKLFLEDDRATVVEELHRCLESPNQVYNWQIRKVHKDGGLLWAEETAQAVYDLNGEPNVLVVCQDVTERKRVEEEIDRLNTDLAVRADELEAANQELKAFNYTVAHDLRGPLNNMGLYFQTIQKLYGAKLDETCMKYLTGGYKSVQHMSQLIDVLLEFSKLPNVEPQRENVDISAVVREMVDELKGASPERRYVFRIADGIIVNGDPKLLRVVLINLLRNAWKYSGKREEAVIEFGVTEIGGEQTYFVRDNGQGFNMADADKLFIPFKRLPGSEEFKGSGIGLATVERIIKRHGGKVWAEGEPDKGACFYFTLSADRVST